MGTILVKNAIKRKSGFLYYVDGAGNLSPYVGENHRRLRSKNGTWRKEKKEINFLINMGRITP